MIELRGKVTGEIASEYIHQAYALHRNEQTLPEDFPAGYEHIHKDLSCANRRNLWSCRIREKKKRAGTQKSQRLPSVITLGATNSAEATQTSCRHLLVAPLSVKASGRAVVFWGTV